MHKTYSKLPNLTAFINTFHKQRKAMYYIFNNFVCKNEVQTNLTIDNHIVPFTKKECKKLTI